jgi:hypothetical protein
MREVRGYWYPQWPQRTSSQPPASGQPEQAVSQAERAPHSGQGVPGSG